MARFKNPKVDAAMPSAMTVAPAGPEAARITSEAGAVLAALANAAVGMALGAVVVAAVTLFRKMRGGEAEGVLWCGVSQ